jgi:2,3-bisphosphoglycerate-independent phosphoglycerate mutase
VRKILLLIIDGLALGEPNAGNAFFLSDSPFLKKILAESPCRLKNYGHFVGLPKDQAGNSEVGHMNIGAGRIVKQQQVLLDEEISSGSLFNRVNFDSKVVHLVGLFSDGGVHSHLRHFKAAIEHFSRKTDLALILHLFSDGRDVPPKSFLNFLPELEGYDCKIATLSGRFYAMDRDKRWERTELVYRAMAFGDFKTKLSVRDQVNRFYEEGLADEFFRPVSFEPFQGIQETDLIIFLNFREDRMRQLAGALCEEDVGVPFERPKIFKNSYSLTCYDKKFQVIKPLFFPPEVTQTLGQIVSENKLCQLRIAETEKYPHVTYFFNCGREEPFPGEERVLVPSPRDIATYDLKPEMSLFEVTSKCQESLKKDYALVVCNFANCDMVGHTGNLRAAIKACEAVDICAKKLVSAALDLDYIVVLTSDHGNCEEMIDKVNNQSHTAHTMNDSFFVILSKYSNLSVKPEGILGNIAPTILQILELPIPPVMVDSLLLGR